MLKRVAIWTASALAVAGVVAVLAFGRDMRRAYERVRMGSQIVPSPFGDIEYSQGGSGPPVLVVHGSGGGFDQGDLLARAVLGDEFHWIAPSRFGYLRSTFQEGATFDEQADAFDFLLDHLGLESVAVLALSHGGPSALLLAVRHPERVSSLVLLSAGVSSSADDEQAGADRQGAALTRIFQHDWLYWLATRLFRSTLLEIMGADRSVKDGLAPDQRLLVKQVVDFMNPVAPRAAGVRFDHRARLPGERIEAIRAPTLVLHAKNDTLQLFRNAEFAAATIPNVKLIAFDRGGHLLLAVEQNEIRRLVQGHVLAQRRDQG